MGPALGIQLAGIVERLRGRIHDRDDLEAQAPLRTLADGRLLVVRARLSERRKLSEALRQLSSARSPMIGTVLNGCDERLPRIAPAAWQPWVQRRAASSV